MIRNETRRYKFTIVPQQGDSVDSILRYATVEEAAHFGKQLIELASRRVKTSRTAIRRMFETKQSFVDVVVVDLVTKEAVSDKRVTL